MNTKAIKYQSPKWLTNEHKARIRAIFEPRYDKSLSDLEVVEIAESLTMFVEHFFSFKKRISYEANN